MKTVELLERDPDGRARQVRFVVDAGLVKDDYVLSYAYTDDLRTITWSLLRAQAQKSQEGSYELSGPPDGPTTVVYSLTLEPSIPMLGMLRRRAEKVIMDTALQELAKRVEG